MSRTVTYCTDLPSKATSTTVLSRMGMMTMQMWPRAYPIDVIRYDSHTHMDYSIEAPDVMPAGACVQYSDFGEADDDFFVCPEQQITYREASDDRPA